ncbi:MAG: hypothetical protein PHU06_11155 [Gallionella sp.]|nr:hypothetical protein [Gallionella sp.]MDD4960058.1 hypothetical protein [Gallionella sp.]
MNINWIQKLKIAIASLALLGLTACGGAGGGGGAANTQAGVVQQGVIIPSGMAGIVIVGQPMTGFAEAISADKANTVSSLTISNNTAGGATPSIDAAGNISYTPNEQDFAAGKGALHIMATLSNGATLVRDFFVDVRKTRDIINVALDATERNYTDAQGNYIIKVVKKTPTSQIAGTLHLFEIYRSTGEFSWRMETTGSTFTTSVLEAPTTVYVPLNTGANMPAQVGGRQVGTIGFTQDTLEHPIRPIDAGLLQPPNTMGSVVFIPGVGGAVYSSQQAKTYTYKDISGKDATIGELSMEVFNFGSNCSTLTTKNLGVKCRNQVKPKPPIILIHGFSGTDNSYHSSIDGGGVDTWGQTAKLLTAQGYPVFEMHWLTYMPFEDAADTLVEFGKKVAEYTGYKPIILAHSFGGIVSHLALQSQGRNSVSSQGVFAKLITLNSPLSGLNSNIGDIYGTKRAKVGSFISMTAAGIDLARGVDIDDESIRKCYSITCVQAGAVFTDTSGAKIPRLKTLAFSKGLLDGRTDLDLTTFNPNDVLKEGEVIQKIRDGMLNNKDSAPFLTVAGFRNYYLFSDFVKNDNTSPLKTTDSNFSLYGLGDGLLTLLSQAAVPEDFSTTPYVAVGDSNFKFNFESGSYPLAFPNATMSKMSDATKPPLKQTKGTCIRYTAKGLSPAPSREYLICPYSAHTTGKQPLNYSAAKPETIFSHMQNIWNPLKYRGSLYLDETTSDYAIAYYDGNPNAHPMYILATDVNYLNVTPVSYAATPSLVANITGRATASGAPQQVGLVGSPALTPITSALVWATIVEKSTGVTKRYFGATSNNNGNFNIDVGSFITDKFGANAVLSNYSVRLKIDTVGRYKSWFKTIDTLSAAVDLGDIDLSQVTSNVAVISPTFATLNTPTTFTVTGTNLPLTAVLSMADAVCQTPTNRAASGFTVSCTPQGTATGVKVITVKTDTLANGGTVIDASKTVNVSAAAVAAAKLFPTGVDALGNMLTIGSPDPHYTILSPNQSGIVVNPHPLWIPSSTSMWIWETSSGQPLLVTRTFRTTVDLTGLNPNTLAVSGTWATDDLGIDILINGVSTGNSCLGFQGYCSFTVNSGFVAGVNTLDFVVQDVGAVIAGFRVDTIGIVPKAAPSNPFTVDAINEAGTAFTVPTGATSCTFAGSGAWSPGPSVGNVATTGLVSWSLFPNYVWTMPTASAFALVASTPSGYAYIGTSAQLAVTAGTVLNFKMNDAVGTFFDNSGALSVTWSCQ